MSTVATQFDRSSLEAGIALDELDSAGNGRENAIEIATTDQRHGRWFGGSVPMLLSLVLHLTTLVGMAICVLTPETPPKRSYLVAAPANQVDSFLPELPSSIITVETKSENSRMVGIASASPAGASSAVSAVRLNTEIDAERGIASGSPLHDAQGVLAADGLGLASAGEEQGGAEFFGLRASGQRFVFVVDSSGSMRGKKWSAACRELLASVKRMGGQQSFYVIFFDHDTHPMFAQDKPEKDLLAVTSSNLIRLKRWLPSIKLGTATRPYFAMQLALRLKPDAIFLLSDGEFSDPTRDFLLTENVKVGDEGERMPKVPVHTIGFHSPAAAVVLAPIAKENGGDYRFVGGRR